MGTADKDLKNVKAAFQKKLSKVNKYRKGFSIVGLAITIDCPLFFGNKEWGRALSEVNEGSFDFVIIVHWSGFVIYDFVDDAYTTYTIEREELDALKRLARLSAEGIIKDDDPVWNS